MAELPPSTKQALEMLEKQLTCGICLQPYVDPKILQCFHVFCEKCLQPLAKSSPQGQAISCPNCRHLTRLPQNGVPGLQGAFFIHHLFDIQHTLQKVSAPAKTECDMCKKREPSCYCRTCEFLCDTCKHVHSLWKEYSSHEIISLDQLTRDMISDILPVEKTLECSKHPDKQLDIYCETCKELICRDCIVKIHRDHHYDLVRDVFPKHKDTSLQPAAFAAIYKEALKFGEAPVAYARVMFLGPAGSGKSSVLDGLMNKSFSDNGSTALADTLDIMYQWVEAADAAEDAWKSITEEDEIRELASLSRQVVENKVGKSQSSATYINDWGNASAVQQFKPKFVTKSKVDAIQGDEKYTHIATQIHKNVTQDVVKASQQHSSSSKSAEVVLHVWDCGGQPVFLDILSVFLTKRTMFLLIFNASQPLNNTYQAHWRHKGKTQPGRKQNITILQLMMQWMQLIHASLVIKNDRTTPIQEIKQGETTEGEATMESRHSSYLPHCPRIMIVGTHGDAVKSKQDMLGELGVSCKGKAFRDILDDKLIVDNTTAGKGKEEDPGYGQIRKAVYDFTHSLTTPTPLAWVSFRKVVQKIAFVNPVLSYKEVVAIADICGIPEEAVPSMLHFYHQLGVFLHYTKVDSLSNTIIAKPQWLIKQLCKLLLPEMYGFRRECFCDLWECLEKNGVLLGPLYEEIWRDCGLEGGAQALADLLEHFDLAKVINSVPRDMEWHKSCKYKYFVPCMLNARPQQDSDQGMQPKGVVRKAATLHITFNTKYIPPGFFVRLAVQMAKKFTPDFETRVYRDSITFHVGDIDRVTISESKCLSSIQVDVVRVDKREPLKSRFANLCVSLRDELFTMCKNTLCWLPSIEMHFALRCPMCSNSHDIDHNMHRASKVFCNQSQMELEHKYWLPLPPLMEQTYTDDGKLTKLEITNVAKEIEERVDYLTKEMEMEYSIERAGKNKSPALSLISSWATLEGGTRHELAKYLIEADLSHVSIMLLMGDLNTQSQDTGMTSANREAQEITVIRQNICFITDTVTIGDNLQWFANQLVEKEFITQRASSGILDIVGITKEDKARKLMDSVFAVLRNTERKKHWFDEFVAIFSEEAAYGELVNKLRIN